MNRKKNCWKGFMIGMGSSLAGLVAMRAYWQGVAPKVEENINLGGSDVYPVDLDNISIVEGHNKGEESATAVLGSLIYRTIVGEEPQTEETKELLSYLVHWGYGILQGGLYGVWQANNGRSPDLKSGATFATGLWLLGDELVVPLLGLQSGPTAVAPEGHINRLGAHLAYGLATAVTSRLLHKIL